MAIPKEHAHAPFLTQMTVLVGNLSFQSVTNHYKRPCNTLYLEKWVLLEALQNSVNPKGLISTIPFQISKVLLTFSFTSLDDVKFLVLRPEHKTKKIKKIKKNQKIT